MASDEETWARATWEGARDAIVHEGARMTLREKLAWLESAHRLAEQIAGNAASEIGSSRAATGARTNSRA